MELNDDPDPLSSDLCGPVMINAAGTLAEGNAQSYIIEDVTIT